MRLVKVVVAPAAMAAVISVGGCSSDSGSAATTTTSDKAFSGARSSLATTASSVVSSALNSGQQAIQNTINSVLAAAPMTFAPGSSDLSVRDAATVTAVALPLKGNDTAVEVKTYASDPSPAAATSLADARGKNIATALESDGIDKARITVRATGNPQGNDVQVDQATIAVIVG